MGTYSLWDIDGEWYGLRFTFEPTLVEALKFEIDPPYRRWDAENKHWRIHTDYTDRAVGVLRSWGYSDSAEWERSQYAARQQREREAKEKLEQEQDTAARAYAEHERKAEEKRKERAERERARIETEERRRRQEQQRPAARTTVATSPYTVLHVLPTAPPEVIDAAYRALAKLYHPDRVGGSNEKMKELNMAYDKVKVK